MCGRAVQTFRAVNDARAALSPRLEQFGAAGPAAAASPAPPSSRPRDGGRTADVEARCADNRNLSPGESAVVFRADAGPGVSRPSAGPEAAASGPSGRRTTWGLIARGGTPSVPLSAGASKHFSNKMFNARSETACDKVSFSKLVRSGRSCVVPVDGFYEWKFLSEDVAGRGNGGKQPYYVHRKDGKPFLLAGLHSSVLTGRGKDDGCEDETLETFTILTTDSCPKLRWLHNRMPVILWDDNSARKWLNSPSREVLREVATFASQTSHKDLTWYAVTRKMSRIQYKGDDCTDPIKIGLSKERSVKSFFQANPKNLKRVPLKEPTVVSHMSKKCRVNDDMKQNHADLKSKEKEQEEKRNLIPSYFRSNR